MDVYNNGPHIIHEMESINFKEGDMIIGNINDIRRTNTMRHHTATHVVGGAARIVLGDHVWQGGSDVNQDRGRLDITHYDTLTKNEIKIISTIKDLIFNQGLSIKGAQTYLDNLNKNVNTVKSKSLYKERIQDIIDVLKA